MRFTWQHTRKVYWPWRPRMPCAPMPSADGLLLWGSPCGHAVCAVSLATGHVIEESRVQVFSRAQNIVTGVLPRGGNAFVLECADGTVVMAERCGPRNKMPLQVVASLPKHGFEPCPYGTRPNHTLAADPGSSLFWRYEARSCEDPCETYTRGILVLYGRPKDFADFKAPTFRLSPARLAWMTSVLRGSWR